MLWKPIADLLGGVGNHFAKEDVIIDVRFFLFEPAKTLLSRRQEHHTRRFACRTLNGKKVK